MVIANVHLHQQEHVGWDYSRSLYVFIDLYDKVGPFGLNKRLVWTELEVVERG